MSTTTRSSPPRWLSGLAASLLPPHRREQVMGDLEERFRSAGPWISYIQYFTDLITVAPRMVWRQRRDFRLRAVPEPLRLGAAGDSLRQHVEAYQLDVYWRNLYNLVCATLLAALFNVRLLFPDHPFHRLACAAGVFAAIYWAFHYQRSGAAHAVPAHAEDADLVEFHKRELARQRRFFRNLWRSRVLVWLPFVAALNADRLIRAGELSATGLVFLAGMTLSAIGARTWAAREFQRQIEQLDALRAGVSSSAGQRLP